MQQGTGGNNYGGERQSEGRESYLTQENGCIFKIKQDVKVLRRHNKTKHEKNHLNITLQGKRWLQD